MNEPRRIIQIAATAVGDCPDFVYALCNDGTVWAGVMKDRLLDFPKKFWEQLPPIPTESEPSK